MKHRFHGTNRLLPRFAADKKRCTIAWLEQRACLAAMSGKMERSFHFTGHSAKRRGWLMSRVPVLFRMTEAEHFILQRFRKMVYSRWRMSTVFGYLVGERGEMSGMRARFRQRHLSKGG